MQSLHAMSHKPTIKRWEMDRIKEVHNLLDRSLAKSAVEGRPRRIQLMAARATAELIARSGELYDNRDSSRFVTSFRDYFVEPTYDNLTYVADEVLEGHDSSSQPQSKNLYRHLGQTVTTLLLGFSPTNPLRFSTPHYGPSYAAYDVALYDLVHSERKRHIVHVDEGNVAITPPLSNLANITPLLANEGTSRVWKAGDKQLPTDLVTLRALAGEPLPHSDQAIGDRLLFLHDRLHHTVFNSEARSDEAS